jgi:hypothetical protein
MSTRPLRWKQFAALAAVLAAGIAGLAGAASPPAASSLGWLAGSWAGTKDGVASEEHWTTPEGGLLVGMHKDVREGRAVFFEYLRIEEQGGKLCYVASPRGAPPTPFCAVEIGDRRVVFENRAHDFPQRILYWLDGSDLHARVEGPEGATDQAEEWVWKRVR